jgi:hypothetical protein
MFLAYFDPKSALQGKNLQRFLDFMLISSLVQMLQLMQGTIQVLRQQRGGWVGLAKCLRGQKIRKKNPRKTSFLVVHRKKS